MLNDTLAAWSADNSDRFAWIGSVPLIQADAAAEELQRAGELGACGIIISSNIENTNLASFRWTRSGVRPKRSACPC